jgi:hypothetical protein
MIQEAHLKQLTQGPSRSRTGSLRQRRDTSERAAFRKAGFNRKGVNNRKIGFNIDRDKEHTKTLVSTYDSPAQYARDKMPSKVSDSTGKVTSSKDRTLYLKRLRRQLVGAKKVHDVDILPITYHKKNDPKELITRGKEYHRAVKDVPASIKKSGGKAGDAMVGKASEVMPGSKDMKGGAKKREALYSRKLGLTKKDPVTKIQSGIVRERTFESFMNEARRFRTRTLIHSTSRDSKAKIHDKGFTDSQSSGSYGQGVYTAPSRRITRDYGHSDVTIRIPAKGVHKVDSQKNYNKKIQHWAKHSDMNDTDSPVPPERASKEALKSGAKAVKVPGAHAITNKDKDDPKGSYVILNKDYADKHIVKNPAPTMKNKSGGRITKTQPKKKVQEEYRDLTPDKEQRVKKRVGELFRDTQLTQNIQRARKNQKLVSNASDALIRTSVSRDAKTMKKIQDIKRRLKELESDK